MKNSGIRKYGTKNNLIIYRDRNIFLYILLLIIFGFLSSAAKIYSQVAINPIAIYMDEKNRSGKIVVQNTSKETRKIEIELRYGYPITDQDGKVKIKYNDSTSSEDPSAVEWLKVFPCSVLLNPGESQTFRFWGQSPESLPDQEYWARPIIISQPVKNQSFEENNFDKITTNIGTIYRVAVSIYYRKGNVNTGVNIENLTHNISYGKINFLIGLRRTGNAAYLGNIILRLRDEGGKIVKEIKRETAVYFTLQPQIVLDIADLSKGEYKAEIELNTERKGVQTSDILNAPRVMRKLSVLL